MSDTVEYDRDEARREALTYEVPSMVERRRLVRDSLDLAPGERVLSIGCGPGFEPAELADAVGETGAVFALDRSPAMLALAERRCADRPNVLTMQGDAVALPVGDEAVDAATAVQVYGYVDDVATALAELARVLRPGGRAVVYETDFDSLVWHSSDADRMERIAAAWNDHCPRPHLGSRLPSYLQDTGLTIETIRPYSIVNTRLDEDTFVYHFMEFVAEYVAEHDAIGPAEATAWAEDLYSIDERNETFFSLTQYLYSIRKQQ